MRYISVLTSFAFLASVNANRGDPRAGLCGHSTVYDPKPNYYISLPRNGECRYGAGYKLHELRVFRGCSCFIYNGNVPDCKGEPILTMGNAQTDVLITFKREGDASWYSCHPV